MLVAGGGGSGGQEVAVLVVVEARLGSVLQHRRPARAFDYIGNYRQSDNMRSLPSPAQHASRQRNSPGAQAGQTELASCSWGGAMEGALVRLAASTFCSDYM
jgi:hypothetical protein